MSDIEVGVRLKADGSGLVGEIRVSREELEKFGTGAQKAGGQADRGFSQARRGAEGAGRQIETLKRQVVGLAGAYLSLQGLGRLTGITDEYAAITAQTNLATRSQEAFATAQSEIFRISQDTSTALSSTTELFARAARSTRELGIEQERILGITETINQSFAVSQTAAGAQANAITQLTQAFAGGVLRAEEFNSVIENAPRLAEALATGMGVGIGELRRQVNDGEVTVARMIAALEDQADEIEAEFGRMPLTIGRAWTQIDNAITRYIGTADQARGTSTQVAEAMSLVADNIDRLISGGITLAKVLATLYGASLLRQAALYSAQLGRQVVLQLAANSAAREMGITTRTGVVASIRQIGILNAALGAVAAGIAGWQIGSWLRDEFLQVRLAGIALVEGLLVGWERLKQGTAIAWEAMKAGAIGIINDIRSAFADDFSQMADGLEFVNVGGVADGAIAALREYEAAMRPTEDTAESLRQKIAEINSETEANISAIRENMSGLADWEIAQDLAGKASRDLSNATRGASSELRDLLNEALGAGDGAEEAEKRIASLKDELTAFRLEAMTPAGRATAEFEQRMATLQELLDEGLIGDGEFAHLADRFKSQFWDQIVEDGVDAAEKMTDEIRRVFETRFGGGLSDELLDTLQGIEELRTALGGIDAPFTGAIDRMLQGLQQFSAAGEAAADKQFGMYAAGIGQMLSGVQGLAQEGSAAYKVLGTASAAAAVASVAAAPWPANLALIPAMIGLMQSLGFGVGGGGFSGGALDTGNASGLRTSGTVLGDPDAGSDSIENAIDRLSDIASQDLQFSSQMAASLRNIETALAGVTAEFGRFAGFSGVQEIRLSGSIGDLTAVAGTRNDDIFDQIQRILAGDIEASESAAATVSADLTAGIQQILDGMGSGIGAAVGALGGDVENALDVFQSIELPDLQFTEKDNLDEALQQFFSSIGDSAVEIVSQQTGLAIEDLQIFGEGALETLTRVASGVEFARDVAGELDVQLASLADVAAGTEDVGAALIRLSVAQANAGTGLAELVEQYVGSADETAEYARELLDLRDTMRLLGDDTADVTREMLNAAGGLDRLQDGLETYREQFFSADEQLAFLRTELSTELAKLGLSLPRTRDAVRDLIESARGNDGLYGALIALTPELDRLFDAQEDVAQSSDNAARAQRQLAESIQATTRSLAQEIARLRNESVAALQIGNVLDAIGSATDPQSLVNAAGSIQAALTAQLQEQLDAINAQSDALDAQNQQQIDALNAQIDAVNEQIRAAEQLRDIAAGIRDYVTGLGFSDLGGGTPAQQLAAAQAAFEAQAQAALSGDIDAARGLSQIADQALRLNADVNASGPAAASIRDAITDRLSQVADAIDVTAPELQALNSQLAVLEQQRTVLEQIRNNQPTQVADLNSVASQEAEALRQETANQLESVQSILGLLADLTLLSRDEQVSAMRILQDALATVIRGGDIDTVAGLDGVRDAISEANAGIVSGDEALTRIFENGFDGLAGAFRDGIVDLASDVSGLGENLTRATLQNAGDIANAIDQANAAAIAKAEIHASAILSPLRLLGIETGNMRGQLVEQFRRQILEQQLTSRLTDILGAETRDVQSLVSAAAQIISGNVTASGASIVRELFGLGQLENLSAEQIADAIRSGDFGLLAGLQGVEAAVRETSAFERQVLAQFGNQFGAHINSLVNQAQQPASNPGPSTGPTTGPTTGGQNSFDPAPAGPTRSQVKELFDQVRSVAFIAEQKRLVDEFSGSPLALAVRMTSIISDATQVALQAARDAVRQAFPDQTYFQFRTGGIASGPDSGYNVELHGTETIMPTVRLPNGQFGVHATSDPGVVAELRASNAEQRRQTRELQAAVRVLQGGFKRTIQQGDEQIRNGSEMARAARLETAS